MRHRGSNRCLQRIAGFCNILCTKKERMFLLVCQLDSGKVQFTRLCRCPLTSFVLQLTRLSRQLSQRKRAHSNFEAKGPGRAGQGNSLAEPRLRVHAMQNRTRNFEARGGLEQLHYSNKVGRRFKRKKKKIFDWTPGEVESSTYNRNWNILFYLTLRIIRI